MLNRVVSSLNNKQGCLLESPTGTGKTLALLCASLGWLEHQRNLGMKVEEPASRREIEHLKYCELSTASPKTENDEDFGEFIEDKRHNIIATCTCGAAEADANDEDMHIITEKATVSRIIYATRTHKQISQVIRELRKTKYANVEMCILSSRKHSCINPEVRKQSNLNDACQNLKGNCPFDLARSKQNLKRHIKALNKNGPWDLEDYVEAMSKVPTCPYVLAFKILERASLCFCPYNYLLDPVFRETVASEIANSVIIIDEAHNIEDAARSATSVTLLERDVIAASDDLKRYLGLLESDPSGSAAISLTAKDVKALIALLDAIHQVMMLTKSRLVVAGTYATSAQVWSGNEIEGLLSTVGLGVDRFESVRAGFNRLNVTIQKEAAINRDSTTRKEASISPSSLTVRLFTYIFTMLKFMYNDNMHRMQDYRAVLMEVIDFEKQPLKEDLNNSNTYGNKWFSKAQTRNSRLVERKSLSLNFWCLSPAVCMRSIAENAYSLILASGTLAPLGALVAELQLQFPVRLEAGHVVPTQRVLAACVARGPNGTRLCATYANQNAFVFQDDVGYLLLESSKCVPGGVLCFFPSYGLMEKMIARWEVTGMLAKLSKVKHVLQEPRSSEKFDEWVADFQEAVDSTRGANEGEVTGALALAVCRGKISEGLDFADDYGRLVVAIGIPFPAYKDPQIEQKRAFNDALRLAGPSQQTSSAQLSSAKPMKRPGDEPSGGLQKPFKIMHASGPPQNRVFPSKLNPPTPLRAALSQSIKDESPQKSIPKQVNASSGLDCSQMSSSGINILDSSQVLSGSAWYEAQAYRALNQALGRCIRHQHDWGAIILAEARFVEQPRRYLPGISRWLRNQFVLREQWSEILMDLKGFVERMTRTSELSSSFV
nr:Fanconi anemia group J protein [Hymenolepis microstoma]